MTTKELLSEIEEEYRKVWPDLPDMVKHCMKQVYAAAKLPNGCIYIVRRPEIKKRFCFGYHNDDYEETAAAAREARDDEEYFRQKNMEQLDEEQRRAHKYRYLCDTYDGSRRLVQFCSSYPGREDNDLAYLREKGHEPWLATDEDRKLIDAAYEEARKKFSRRVETYLKKYGLSKVRSWTYWADA